MKIWPEMEQRSEAWFRARAGRPTASNFDRLITPTGKDSSQWDDYALELCAQCIRPDEIAWEGNAHTDRGNELEPEARGEFERIMNLAVDEVGFVTRADEVIGCSPDGLVGDWQIHGGLPPTGMLSRTKELPAIDDAGHCLCDEAGTLVTSLRYEVFHPIAGLELKCPLSKHHARYLIDGELPAKYRPQVHGSMAVTGLRHWYFMSYCPGLAPFITRVDWDDYTDKMADVLDRFLVFYAARRKALLPRLMGKEAA